MTSSKITALVQPPDKKGRVDVYADGEYLMSVSEDAAVEARLRVGMEIDEASLSAIERSSQLARAKNKAYDYLSYGDMSEKKLFDKLCRFGFSEEIALECVDELRRAGYIDNARYASALADSLANSRLYGPRRIIQELRQRGIDGDTAQSAVDGLDTDYGENVRKLACGTLRRDMTNPREIQKLIAALMRRGYDYDTVKSSLASMIEEEETYE